MAQIVAGLDWLRNCEITPFNKPQKLCYDPDLARSTIWLLLV